MSLSNAPFRILRLRDCATCPLSRRDGVCRLRPERPWCGGKGELVQLKESCEGPSRVSSAPYLQPFLEIIKAYFLIRGPSPFHTSLQSAELHELHLCCCHAQELTTRCRLADGVHSGTGRLQSANDSHHVLVPTVTVHLRHAHRSELQTLLHVVCCTCA